MRVLQVSVRMEVQLPIVDSDRTDSGCALMTRLALFAGDEGLVEVFQPGVGQYRQWILVLLTIPSSRPHSLSDAATREP